MINANKKWCYILNPNKKIFDICEEKYYFFFLKKKKKKKKKIFFFYKKKKKKKKKDHLIIIYERVFILHKKYLNFKIII